MKRDMELIRKILFKIEEEYVSTALVNLRIDSYEKEQIAHHCKLIYEANLIDDYSEKYASNDLYLYSVGALTWEGHDFLDQIRQDTIWNKIKNVITRKGLPVSIDIIKSIATSIISSMTQSAIKGLNIP